MTTFDASAATQDFDFLYSGDAIDFASQVAANATTYSWLTSTGHRVTATGTFAYPGGNVSGFVTSIAIDLANNSNTDIAITNIANADIANLLAGHDLFWSTLFSGGDTFTGPGTVHGTFTGDVIGGGSGVGGADSFTFNLVNTGLEVSGDGGVGVANTTFHGWHDTFSISGSLAAAQDNFVYGDLQSAGNKTAYGGDDTFSISLSGSVVLSVFGDLRYSEESQTTGGNDTITVSSGTVTAYGDADTAFVLTSNPGSTFTGGDDTISGARTAFGDVETTYDIDFRGGDDTVSGTAGADFLYGDAGMASIFLVGSAFRGGDDTLWGAAQDDEIYGDVRQINAGQYTFVNFGDDIIHGGAGNDSIWGDYDESVSGIHNNTSVNVGNDTIDGNAGDDTIYGNSGNDLIDGGPGGDFMDGGAHTDTVSYASATSAVTVSLALQGAVQNTVGAGLDTLVNFENLTGSSHADTLTGDGGGNVIEGGAGGDAINGGGGIDTASYESSASRVNVQLQYGVAMLGDAAGDTFASIENLTGSAFNDTLIGNPGENYLIGGKGNDILKGLNGADQIDGGEGDDWLYVDYLDTFIYGSTGFDRVFVTNGNGVSINLDLTRIEVAYGNTGNDHFDGDMSTENLTLRGYSGDDILIGGDGDDYVFGDSGADELRGGGGLDRLYIDADDTLIDGGTGDQDRLIVTGTAGVKVDMKASRSEVAYGNAGDDTFDGSTASLALSLYGRAGADILNGGSANDRLYGDNGTSVGDILNGGMGNDYLYGGTNTGGWAERDQFVFDDDWGNDRIFDFADNVFEKIDFSSVAGITKLGDLTITNGSGFALISYTESGNLWSASIRVDGVTAADLGANDFIFV